MFTCREQVEVFDLLVCWAASVGSCLPTFRDNISVPSWRIKLF